MRPYTEDIFPPAPISTPITAGAGFGIRFLARGIDLLYGLFLSLLVGFAGGILFAILEALKILSPDWAEKIEGESGTGLGVGILCFFLYHACAEGISGTSIGKLICRLSVVQIDGRPCTMLGALKRDLAYHMDALFFGLIANESMKKSVLRQRYGDVWGKTVVVKNAVFVSSPKHSAWRLLIGIFIGSLVFMAVLFADMLHTVL